MLQVVLNLRCGNTSSCDSSLVRFSFCLDVIMYLRFTGPSLFSRARNALTAVSPTRHLHRVCDDGTTPGRVPNKSTLSGAPGSLQRHECRRPSSWKGSGQKVRKLETALLLDTMLFPFPPPLNLHVLANDICAELHYPLQGFSTREGISYANATTCLEFSVNDSDRSGNFTLDLHMIP